ncbi:sugar transferase [Blastococcus sp. SYSU DS0617]
MSADATARIRSFSAPGNRGRAPDPTPLPPFRRSAGWQRLFRFGARPLLVALDVLAVALALVAAEGLGAVWGVDAPGRAALAFGVLLLLTLWNAGLYRSRLSLSVLDDLPVLTGRWLVSAALLVVGRIAWDALRSRETVIEWRFLWGALAIGVLVLAFRALGYWTVRRMRARGAVIHPTLVVGAGQVGSDLAEVLHAHPEYGLRPVGFLDDDPPDHPRTVDLPMMGGADALQGILQRGEVHAVVVAFCAMKESDMVRVIRTCDRFRCELFLVPRFFELHQVGVDMDSAWGFPLVRLRRSTYRSATWPLKRLTDVLLSGLALAFLAPLLALLALAVRIDGGPGVLFRQVRVGVDGRRFELLKFRSLRPASSAESATTWNVADDPRLSPFGRLLRATSLDELPQLYNVLRGDMSLVGPRPERPYFVSQFEESYPSYGARHRVPSGVTGLAQVHGLRGDTSIADRARFDNYYIENWSLWLDVKIMLRTFAALLRSEGR